MRIECVSEDKETMVRARNACMNAIYSAVNILNFESDYSVLVITTIDGKEFEYANDCYITEVSTNYDGFTIVQGNIRHKFFWNMVASIVVYHDPDNTNTIDVHYDSELQFSDTICEQ